MITLKMTLFQAWRSISVARMRSLLAVIAIGIGVASMIALMNIGYNTKKSILQEFESFGYRVTKMDVQQLPGYMSLVQIESLNETFIKMPAINTTELVATTYGQLSHCGHKTDVAIHAISKTFEHRMGLSIEKGFFLSKSLNDRPYILLGYRVAEVLRTEQSSLRPGSLVTLNDHETYFVSGILSEHGDTNLITGGIDDSIFILNSGVFKSGLKPESATNLFFRESGSDYREIESRVVALFKATAPDLSIRLLSPEQLIASISKQNHVQTILIFSLALVSLLSGGIGIMNIMLVSVQERKSEIGIRIAVGARPIDVRRQITLESVILCVLGCTVGVLLGVIATFFYTWLQGWAFRISIHAILYAVFASTWIGIFFGYYPARLASKLDPVQALMH